LAGGHVDVEFVAGPGLFVALAVFLAADESKYISLSYLTTITTAL
jgi:hypothetical protein